MSQYTNNLAPADIVPRLQSQPLFDAQVQSSPYQCSSQFRQPISQSVTSLGSNLAGYNDRMDPTMGTSALTSHQLIAKYVCGNNARRSFSAATPPMTFVTPRFKTPQILGHDWKGWLCRHTAKIVVAMAVNGATSSSTMLWRYTSSGSTYGPRLFLRTDGGRSNCCTAKFSSRGGGTAKRLYSGPNIHYQVRIRRPRPVYSPG